MKKLLILFLFCSFLNIAQSMKVEGNESLSEKFSNQINQTDIAQLIQIQIDSALALNERGEIRSSSFIADNMHKENLIDSAILYVPVTESYEKDKSEGGLNKLIIIVVFSVAVMAVVLIRRMFKPFDSNKKESFKEKFLALRNENLLIKEDSQSEELRRRLIKTYDTDIVGNSLTIKAKELGISQGELMLAAKIKSFQLSELSESKI